MSSFKVRCEDCAEYKGERCEVKMKYMNPKTPRYCKAFKPTAQATFEPWTLTEHAWPP